MNRPKIEDFKPKYTKGVAEIASVTKQYVKAQEKYIDYLEQLEKNCSIPDVGQSLPTDEQIGIEIYHRDFFEREMEIGFEKGAKWMRDKVAKAK